MCRIYWCDGAYGTSFVCDANSSSVYVSKEFSHRLSCYIAIFDPTYPRDATNIFGLIRHWEVICTREVIVRKI